MRFLQIFAAAFLITGAFTLAPCSALAQKTLQNYEVLNDLNKRNPLQNGEFQRARDVINSRVLDNKNKVVGRVKDMVINDSGTISDLKIEFDRLRLAEPIYISMDDGSVRADNKGYVMGVDDDAIAELYPTLLNNIETASSNSYRNDRKTNLSRLVGASLRSAKNERLGKVADVLFMAQGSRVEALYVKLTYGSLRNETLAIPLRHVKFKNENRRTLVVVDNDFTKTMLDFAKYHH